MSGVEENVMHYGLRVQFECDLELFACMEVIFKKTC